MIFCPLPLIDGSPLFQAELERNIAAIIQQDLEHVSLVGDVYRSILSTDVKDPLLARGIPKAVSGVVEAGRLARPRYFRPYWKKIDDPSFKLIAKK